MAQARVAVFFPGTGYTCEMPLLKRTAARYEALGYTAVRLDYGRVDFGPMATVEEAAETVRETVRAQTRAALRRAVAPVFVGKSFGTLVAAELAAETDADVRFVLYTPIPQADACFCKPENVLFTAIGSRDPFYDAAALQALCKRLGVRCFCIANAGHSLVPEGQSVVPEAVMAEMLALCR